MRLIAHLVLSVALAVPVTADAYSPHPGDVVTPSATGLSLSRADGSATQDVPFGSPFHSTMHTLVWIFGHDVEVGFPQECGAGPLVSAHIPGQIDLMFQDDRLVGWMLIDDSAMRTGTGLGVGSPREALAAEGEAAFFETGIGTEFAIGETFGLMSEDGASVQAIWAGTNCIFR